MIKSDFHTHTCFSDDCNTPFEECINSAKAQGMDILAITDHYDPGYPNPDFPFLINFDEYLPALLNAKAGDLRRPDGGLLSIAAGIEVGIKEGEFQVSEETLKPAFVPGYGTFNYDVVIGSFHCYKDMDISVYSYTDENLQRDGYASSRQEFLGVFFEYMYRCLKAFDNYDILGHMSVMDRYIGDMFDYAPYSDVIDEILKLVIDGGKSLEINTSTFHYRMDTWLPRESILRRYRQLGGEMITFGSDSHNPKYYRSHFDDAAEFARSLGFKYHCTYENRVPQMDTL